MEVLLFMHKACQTPNRVLQKTDSYERNGKNVENITVPALANCYVKQEL